MNAASLIQAVKDRFPDGVRGSHSYRDDATVILARECLLEAARTVKEDPVFQMNFLMDLTAVDFSTFGKKHSPALFASSGIAVSPSPEIPDQNPWPGPPGPARFVVVYHFFSLPLKHRLRLEVSVEDVDAEEDSLSSLWAGDAW